MKLYATSDLHLTLSVPSKDMTKFGPNWENHIERIKQGWCSCVKPDDIVAVVGDVSWATTIEQAKADFDFLDSLPGRKIITVGNHDYWHQTATKSNNYFFDNYKTMVPLIRNDYWFFDDVAVCAVKGYMNENHPEFKDEYRKSYERECLRLENTLKIIPSTFETTIVLSHYPPIHKGYDHGHNTVFELMKKYQVDKCIYGHLHAEAVEGAYIGNSGGIQFTFVAGDSMEFKPVYITNLG